MKFIDVLRKNIIKVFHQPIRNDPEDIKKIKDFCNPKPTAAEEEWMNQQL